MCLCCMPDDHIIVGIYTNTISTALWSIIWTLTRNATPYLLVNAILQIQRKLSGSKAKSQNDEQAWRFKTYIYPVNRIYKSNVEVPTPSQSTTHTILREKVLLRPHQLSTVRTRTTCSVGSLWWMLGLSQYIIEIILCRVILNHSCSTNMRIHTHIHTSVYLLILKNIL